MSLEDDFYLALLREDVTLKGMAMRTESELDDLLKKVNITAMGARLRIQRSCSQLRGNFSETVSSFFRSEVWVKYQGPS